MTRTTNLLTTLPLLSLLAAIGSEATAFAGDPLAAKALGQCKSIDCLRATIPSEKGKLLAASDCKVVEGRKDPLDVDLELGSVCRVLVARARAAFRGAAPCVSIGGIQPNWDPDLDKMYELALQNLQLAETPFKRRGIKLNRGGHPIGGVPRFGIPAFHRIAGSGDRFVEFATYSCIADRPRRYVPFYYSLRIGDEIGEGQIVEEQVVNHTDAIPVLLQSRQFHHDDDVRVFVLADLNGDKKQDKPVLSRGLSLQFQGSGLRSSHHPSTNHRGQKSDRDASRSREERHASALGHGIRSRHHRSMALPHGRIRAEESGQVAATGFDNRYTVIPS
jgi:hypothetical protein